MYIKRIILLLFLFVNIPFYCQEKYKPEIGDNVILVFYLIKQGTLQEAESFFNNTFIDNIKNPESIKTVLYLKNIDSDEIVIISFCKLNQNLNSDMSKDHYNKEVKSVLKSDSMSISFRLLTVNAEKFNPKLSDVIVIWEYNYLSKSLSHAINLFNEKIYPLLQEENYTKNSYLLLQKKLNIYAGITIFSGKNEDSIRVKESIKKADKYFWKNASSKFFKIIKID
jgi:hypothetical protein